MGQKETLDETLQKLNNSNINRIAANFFGRWFASSDKEGELEKIKSELSQDNSMTSIFNGIWASLQNMIEDSQKK